jgi:hypothetical protein
VNVTCEEYETFSQSRGRENDILINAFHNDNSNNALQPTTLRRNMNNITNNIMSNINNINNNFPNNEPSENEENLDISAQTINNNNLNIQINITDSVNNRNFESQIDEIYDSLTYLITSEKNNLKSDKLNLKRERNKFSEKKNSEVNKFEQEKEQWAENLKIVESLKCKETDILDLDIGGTQKFSTTRSTLMKYANSALSAMFSGRHELPKHNGRVFIDRDGMTFLNMVNYLRTGKFPIFKEKAAELAFYEELEFWQIPLKENDNNSMKTQLQFDSEWCANTLILEQNNSIIKKHNCQHGIIFGKAPLDMYNPYIEFKVVMNIPSRGKSHLFVGLVDRSKYKYEHLVSTFWKDSPSSYYWDVWNTKLIKTDENGSQIGSIGGYGSMRRI